jgi:branched-subunit amino acid aminotransferase/4-amino-4-deoxychorismate lyase
LVCSTTADVSAAVMLNKKKVGTGKPGPVYKLLRDLLLDDLQNNQTLRTPVFSK